MTTDGFLIFQSILRERKISLQHLRIVYVFCEYTRRQAIPGFCGHPQGLRQQLTQKASQGVGRERGWVGGGGWGDKRRDHLPFPFHLFSPKASPHPPPSQFATATKAINHCPSIHGEVSYAWSRSINVLVHVDQKMVNSSLTRTRLSTSSATMS